jgi:uncharacterized protein (TIGR00297 family)
MSEASNQAIAGPLFTTRKIVHMSMLLFAFLLPFLTWVQAAGCAVLALLFNVLILPRLEVDLGKACVAAGFSQASAVEAGSSRAGSMPVTTGGATLVRAATSVAAGESTWTGIVLYPISVLALILFYRHSLHVVGAVWAIMALGDGMASVVGERLRGPAVPWNHQKSWPGFLGFVFFGSAGAYVLTRWISPATPVEKAASIALASALVGALVETAPIRLDDNLTVPLVTGAFMFCAFLVERSALDSNLPYLGRRTVLALLVNLVFALLALAVKAVDRSGAACGFILGVAVYLGYGYKSFLILFAFVLLGSVTTRLGFAKKASRGIAEGRGGARSWREALANSVAGAFFALLVITTHREAAFLMALVAAFAEATGDTVSSEVGQWISDRAYLITTLKPVPAGENGGVSLAGTVAGVLASALVVGLGYALGLVGRGAAAGAMVAAFVGVWLDSLLGATLERRGLVTNGVVNFTGTSFAGAVALCVAFRLGM